MLYTIGVCGYSGTGSSAVSDLLKEYAENQVIDQCEFILPYEPDGLSDLAFHLNEGCCKFSSSNTAVFRFRKAIRGGQFRFIRELTGGKLIDYSEEFLAEVIQCTWIGSDPANLCNQPIRDLSQRAVRKLRLGGLFYTLEKMAGRDLNIYPMGEMNFSAYPAGFYEASRKFLKRVLNAIAPLETHKNIVLDQPFPGNNPAICFPFFDNPKAIVVDRDPRDLYLLTKEYWFRSQAWRPLPTNTVDQFITYYRSLRGSELMGDSKNVLRIKFEDLIYNYERTRALIEEFCDLSCNINPKTNFNPSRSVNNTQLFKFYVGYEKDIDKIEKELSEYCFPFECYEEPTFNRAAMFD